MIENLHPANDTYSGFSAHLGEERDTAQIGAALAAALLPGLVIYLEGDLGAGKTTLVRGVLRALGYAEKVKSPTYTLIEPYVVSRLNLYHFDFYRFSFPEEFLEAGLEEYFSGEGACLVEWPDKAAPYIAKPDVKVALVARGTGRLFEVAAATEAGRPCVQKMYAELTRDHA